MTPAKRRALIQHAIALDAVVLATGVALLAPDSPLLILGAFLAAIAAVAWSGQEELGLFATGYSVVVLGVFFNDQIDVAALTMLALAGAAISTLVRALRRSGEPLAVQEQQAAEARAAAPGLPFSFVLPLLVIVVYTDVSDTIMRLYHVPSLLQPIIALSAMAVWIGRAKFRPREVLQAAPPLFFAIYIVVMLSTGVWATDPTAVDSRVGEAAKALCICILITSLAASWGTLRRGLDSLVIAAACLGGISTIQLTTGRFFEVLGGLVEPQSGNIYGQLELPRASGPPVNDPNFYARILLLAVPLAVALGVIEKNRLRKIAYYAAAALVTSGVIFTYSRGAMLALAAIGVMFLAALKVRPMTIAAAAVAGLLLLSFVPTDLAERRLETLKTLVPGEESSVRRDTSIEVRKVYARAALQMFEAHPWTGVGAGHYTLHYRPYANRVGSSAYDYLPAGYHAFPHNMYLEIASETGLPGLAAFFATIAATFLTLWRARRGLASTEGRRHAFLIAGIAIAIAGYLAASVFLHETHLRYLGLLLGFTCAAARLARRDEDGSTYAAP